MGALKVCIVVPYDLGREGGVKKHSMHLMHALRRLGDEVDVIGPSSDPRVLGGGVYGFGGVQNMSNNGSAAHIGIFAPPWKVWRLLRARRYDVLHVHEPLVPSLNYWALFSAGRAARVCTFHSFSEADGPSRAQSIMARVAYPLYDRGIAVSSAAESCARSIWHRPLTIIPNGVPTTVYLPPPSAVPTTGGPVRLLFVGHWQGPRKGLPHLLEAYRKLRAQGVSLALDVVGDGGSTKPEALEGVTYHGPVSSEIELAQHYARCDIFVAPATGQESFGIVLLEAMSAERAVICSDIEGFRCAVGENANTGALLVAPGSADALVKAIAALAADPERRRRMGTLNRKRSLEFDWERIAGQVRSEYLMALETRRSAR